MTIGNAIILGLVQGLAEFLPISSSGHLAILQNLFNMSDLEGGHLFFDVLLHFGTMLSICFVYWNDIVKMFYEVLDVLTGKSSVPTSSGKPRRYPAARLFFLIVAATVPLFLVLPFKDSIDALSSKTVFVGVALILTGCVLYVSDKMPLGRKTEKSMGFLDAVIVGVCQCVATIPGLSRSGVTITGCLATGQSRSFAVKFSLLMSIPAVFGATFLEFLDVFKVGVDLKLIPAYLIGMVVAMVSGFFAITLVRRLVNKGGFGGFAYYCWLVGAVSIILTVIF